MFTAELKQKRVKFSKTLFDELISQEMTNFSRIITGDESWFFLEYFHDRIWSISNENGTEMAWQIIGSDKHILTIL
jgi:hypothetical protein